MQSRDFSVGIQFLIGYLKKNKKIIYFSLKCRSINVANLNVVVK